MKDMHDSSGFNKLLDSRRFQIIKKFIQGITILEVGPGNNHMTKKLEKHYNVDTTEDLENHIIPVNNESSYSCIIATNVIEHITDVRSFLNKAKQLGSKDTVYIFSVPNAESINRIVGVDIGILSNVTSLGEHDKKINHVKMYTWYDFESILNNNDFEIIKSFTSIFKPFQNSIMDKLPKDIQKYCLDKSMGDYGAEIFVVTKLK